MGQPKVYEVSFLTRKGCTNGWGIHVKARSERDAVLIASDLWKRDEELSAKRTFGMMARVVPPAEDDYPPNVFFRY